MRSVLITGGTGFFGQAFVRAALEAGAGRIAVYSRSEHAQALMREEFKDDERLRWFIGDVREADRLEEAMAGIDLVVHAAALKRIEVGYYNPDEMQKTNVDGTRNVIKAARRADVLKVVFLSSDKAFEPCSPYGISKASAENLILSANRTRGSSGPRFSAVRYGNVWNSTGSIVPTWKRLIDKGEQVVPVTDPECTRFFMTRQQAVDLVKNTAEAMKGGELNIPDLPAYRVGDLAEALGVGVMVKGLPDFEKRHESMGPGNSSDKARRMSVDELRKELAHV